MPPHPSAKMPQLCAPHWVGVQHWFLKHVWPEQLPHWRVPVQPSEMEPHAAPCSAQVLGTQPPELTADDAAVLVASVVLAELVTDAVPPPAELEVCAPPNPPSPLPVEEAPTLATAPASVGPKLGTVEQAPIPPATDTTTNATSPAVRTHPSEGSTPRSRAGPQP